MSSVLPVDQETSAADRVRALESEYLLQNYARYPLVLDRGKGCYVFDLSGQRYLDFIVHPEKVDVFRKRARIISASAELSPSDRIRR